MVDGIVVNQRGEVNEFDDSGQGERVRVGTSPDLAHQKEESWTKKLPPHPEEIFVHLVLQIEVGKHNPADFFHYQIEPVTHRVLNLHEPGSRRRGRRLKMRHEIRDAWEGVEAAITAAP